MNEYEHEPVRGLPEDLPAGESIVWQGCPDWRSLARRAFHVRKVMFYFALLLAWYVASHTADGVAARATLTGALWTVATAAAAVGILCLLAWAFARSTVYTLTNQRLVLRFGVALPMMINLPLQKLESADLVQYGNGLGDIVLTLAPGERISYWALWPHARPWHFARVKPMLRGLPNAAAVASLLAEQVGIAASDPESVTIGIESATPTKPARTCGRQAPTLPGGALTT